MVIALGIVFSIIAVMMIIITTTIAVSPKVLAQEEEEQQKPQQQANSDLFLTYTHPKFGYSIQYPSDWQVITFPDEPNTIDIATADRSAFFVITVNDTIAPGTTLQDMINSSEFSLPNTYNNSIIALNNYVTQYSGIAGNNPAIIAKGTFISHNPITGPIEEKIVLVYSIIGSRGYIIGMMAPANTFSDYSQTFESMLYSFDINEEVNGLVCFLCN
jgi:hypothetical protein